MKNYTNKKILYYGIIVLVLIFLIGTFVNNKKVEEQYNFPSPAEVVKQYFVFWNNKDYPDMYATISDGFKKIDSNTKDLATFKSYVEPQNIKINILSITEKSNDGQTATVDYSVEFITEDNSKKKFDGTFTLKYKGADIIQGWKLIHPYGDNIDNS